MAILDLINNRTDEISLSDYISEDKIFFIESSSKEEALEYLSNKVSRGQEDFYKAIIDREKIVTTGIGFGVAIPHARLPIYNDFFIIIGVQQGKGLEWDAVDNSLVKIILMVGGPDNLQTEYLKILSLLTIAIKEPERRKHILRAKSPLEIINLF